MRLLAFIMLLLVVACSTTNSSQTQNSPSTSTALPDTPCKALPVSDITLDKTATNNGATVAYPSTWSADGLRFDTPEGRVDVTQEKGTLEAYTRSFIAQADEPTVCTTALTGLPAYQSITVVDTGDYNNVIIYLDIWTYKNGNIYRVSYRAQRDGYEKELGDVGKVLNNLELD
jgi:hypothetical protein